MRVLWITDRFPPDRGGVAASALRQVKALAPHLERLDVLLLTAVLPVGRVACEEGPPVRIFRLGRARSDDESLQLLARAAQNLAGVHRYHLIHGFCVVHAGYVAALVARQLHIPGVVSLRGNDLDRATFHGPRLPFLLWSLAHARAITGVTAEILEKARALGDRQDGLFRIPNAVDPEVFRPDGPTAQFADAPRPWIGFAGELRLKKGFPVLLDLADLLAARDLGTLFWIGGVRADAERQVSRWRAASPLGATRVREIPYVSDAGRLAESYRAMDLFVFPSLWDGLPNALLEVMACGRPVLATEVGGFPEVVRSGQNGFLLPPHRLDMFPGEAVRVASLETAELARLGVAARDRVVRDFSPDRERDALLALYRSLVP